MGRGLGWNKKALRWKETEGGCWEVVSHSCNKDGYPHRKLKGKTVTLSRITYEESFGLIPEGVCVCHKCDNPKCINPEHLFLGTHADNMRDKKEKRRCSRLKGEKHGQAKLTEGKAREIKELKGKVSQRVLAKRYGVSPSMVSMIQAGVKWGHL